MEIFHLENDIQLLCVNAASFPAGILAAHQHLHSIIPFSTERKYFGISRPNENRMIIYKAAAEQLHPGEAENWNLETFVLKKGQYINSFIRNYRDDLSAIGKAFEQLLTDPRIDPNGACVEWYLNDTDVRCMVRLDSNHL